MQPDIQVLRSVSEIDEIRDHWMRLQWHPNSDIDVYRVVLRSMSSVVAPHVLVLWSDGTPKAILAGRIENNRLSLRLGYSAISGPMTRSLVFIYGCLLGNPSPKECEFLVEKIIAGLRKGDANRVFFNHLRTDSPLYEAAVQVPNFCSRDHCLSTQVHRQCTLPGSVAEFRGRLSPKVRSNLKWEANRLIKHHNGKVRIECFSKPEELAAMTRDIEAVAVRTYQRGLGAGFQDSSEDRQRLQLKAEKGWLRSYILYVEDNPCAFWSGTLYNRTFHSDYMGFDPAYRQYSPGKYLLVTVIEAFCERASEREVMAIDYGLGDAEYKRIFSDQEWQDASPSIFAPNITGVALNAYRTPLMQLDRIGRGLLSDRLEARVKRLWRDRVAHRKPGALSTRSKPNAIS